MTEKQKKQIEELKEILKQPSIAAKNQGMQKMAEKIEQKLKELGAETKKIQVENSYPYIYAEIGEGPKTLLIYDHYDVQPCDNIDLWESDPFEPEIRDGKLYARGVSDNKGYFMLRVQAIREILEEDNKLPIKIKFLVEGEEEIGSPNLHTLSEEYGYLWEDADICLWESGGVNENDEPEMALGQKGITYIELSCEKGERDLHSGNASFVDSPVWRLVHALSTLRDKNGKVTVPELQKQIKEPTEKEEEIIKNKKWDGDKLLESFGREEFLAGRSKQEEVLNNHYFAGTCNICGIWGGFTELGGIKTVIPNKATAKIDFRLVADQDSTRVADFIRDHLDKNGFDDVKVKELLNEPVSKSDINNPLLQKVVSIIGEGYGTDVQLAVTAGSSGPGYYVASKYNMPIFHLGGGYPGTKAHAPNENVRLEDYFKVIEVTKKVIRELGKIE